MFFKMGPDEDHDPEKHGLEQEEQKEIEREDTKSPSDFSTQAISPHDESSSACVQPKAGTGSNRDILEDIAIPCAGIAEDGTSIHHNQQQQRGRRRSSSLDSQKTCSDVDPGGEHDHQVPRHHHSRSRSRHQPSLRSLQREAEPVPRAQRRGLLGRITLIDEVTDPYAYSRGMKWTLTFVVSVAAAAAPMGSSIVLPALHAISRDFSASATVVNLNVSLWMLSMAIFPLWWSSFSETLGRRTIYIVSFGLYLVFNVLAALSTDIGMLLAMRALSGGAAASVQAVGAGSIADFWEPKERGRAMGIFYLGPLCGPLLSPIIGGIMTQRLGWRSTEWFLAIFGGVVLVLIVFCLPETLRQRKSVVAAAGQEAVAEVAVQVNEKDDVEAKVAPATTTTTMAARPALTRTTTKQSVQIKTKKYLAVLRRCFLDPLRIMLYAQFPAVAICVAYGSITFTSLYILNVSVQQNFAAPPYNYPSIIVGLLYIPSSLGYILSSVFGGKWVDQIMHREARRAGRYDDRGKLIFRPEDRMKENAWLGAIMYPVAMVVYGWTVEFGVSVAAPMVANFFFGVGSMMIFAVATTMLTEFMPRKASNGVALNNFVRNILGCVGTIVTQPLIDAIGSGCLFTILGVVTLVGGALTIWVMKKFGDHWRIKMDKNMARVMGE